MLLASGKSLHTTINMSASDVWMGGGGGGMGEVTITTTSYTTHYEHQRQSSLCL